MQNPRFNPDKESKEAHLGKALIEHKLDKELQHAQYLFNMGLALETKAVHSRTPTFYKTETTQRAANKRHAKNRLAKKARKINRRRSK